MQPLWKTVWRLFKKLKIELSFDPAIPLLGIHPDKSIIRKDTCNPMFISSVQLLSRVWLLVTPWTAACQASLSITNSQSPLKLMSIKSVMPSNYLILCRPVLLLPSIFPSIWVFSDEEIGKSKTFGGEKSKIIVLTVFVFWWGLLGVSHFVLVKYRGKREIFCSSTS